MAERSIKIDAPVQTVFAYVSDISRHSEWAQHELKLEQTSSGAIQVGATFHSVGHQLGREFESEVRITEFVPGEKLAFESEGKDFHFAHHFLLQSEDGGTRLTKGGEAKRVGFPFNLALPVLSALGVLNRNLDRDLAAIKANIEAGAAPAEAAAPAPQPEVEASPEPQPGEEAPGDTE
jgi:uncharacterized protein YndB with AHSA1/START domain